MKLFFIETGLVHLKAEICKRQYKFWEKIVKRVENDPDSAVMLIFTQAMAKNLHYIRHYMNLHKKFKDADSCYTFYAQEFSQKMRSQIIKKAADQSYGILTDYLLINRDLSSPLFYHEYNLPEAERQVITKYRCGSHYLKIVTGSFSRTPREERFCKCKEVQTLKHVIFDCPLTHILRGTDFPASLEDFFKNVSYAAAMLLQIEDTLKLRK